MNHVKISAHEGYGFFHTLSPQMNFLLLSAGHGSRLRPITNTTPKCLVPVGGVPILEIWIDKIFRHFPDSQVFVNTHYLSEKVHTALSAPKYAFKRITIIHEPILLGTAQTIFHVLESVAGDLFVAHVDNYTNFDLPNFVDFFYGRPSWSDISLLTFTTAHFQSCGILGLDPESGRIRDYWEKSSTFKGDLANGAVFIISKTISSTLRGLCLDKKDFCADCIPVLLQRISVWYHEGFHIDIGSPEKLAEAERLASTAR